MKVKALVGGAIGEVPFAVGDTIDLDDPTAQSWIEQGLVEDPDPAANRQAQLEAMTVLQLRDLAAELDIPGRTQLTKAELIEAIIEAEGV